MGILGVVLCPFVTVWSWLLKAMFWITDNIFGLLLGTDIPGWISNWVTLILIGIILFHLVKFLIKNIFWVLEKILYILQKTVFGVLTKKEHRKKYYNVMGKYMKKVRKEVKKGSLEEMKNINTIVNVFTFIVLVLFIGQFFVLFPSCNISFEGIPNPADMKNQINDWKDTSTDWLNQDNVKNIVKFVVLPLGVFFILFTVMREISLFQIWIDVFIALVLSSIFSISFLIERFSEAILSDAFNLIGFILAVIVVWKSWKGARRYAEHYFEGMDEDFVLLNHILFHFVLAAVYGGIGVFIGHLIFDVGIIFSLLGGAILGFIIAFIEWFQFYKIPQILRANLIIEKRKLRNEINELDEIIMDPSTSQTARNIYLEQRKNIQERIDIINTRLDELNDRKALLKKHGF